MNLIKNRSEPVRGLHTGEHALHEFLQQASTDTSLESVAGRGVHTQR